MPKIELLRLSPREAAKILNEIESQARKVVTEDRRKSPRVPYRDFARVAIMLENDEVGRRTFGMLPRNISRAGMSLLHGKFVYDGTACVLGLKTLDGQAVPVRGRVGWCRLITGRIHELGITFDDPIDLEDFVPTTPRRTA